MSEDTPQARSGGPRAVEALGGPQAARIVADSAALVEIAAGASVEAWSGAAGTVAQAAKLGGRASELGGVDAEAYARAIDVLRRRAELDPGGRDWEIGEAVGEAAAPPLELVELAGDVCSLAAEAADRCPPHLRADLVSACLFCQAAGRAALHLLEVNLTVTRDDRRLAVARRRCEAMRTTVDRALAAG